jgi:hypothetical protein
MIKTGIISLSVRKLYIDRRVAPLHQHWIEKQSAGTPVTVNEWMNTLESQMK